MHTEISSELYSTSILRLVSRASLLNTTVLKTLRTITRQLSQLTETGIVLAMIDFLFTVAVVGAIMLIWGVMLAGFVWFTSGVKTHAFELLQTGVGACLAVPFLGLIGWILTLLLV